MNETQLASAIGVILGFVCMTGGVIMLVHSCKPQKPKRYTAQELADRHAEWVAARRRERNGRD